MSGLAFDTLEYAEDLTQGGVDEEVAKAHAKALNNAMQSNLVTKTDLKHEIALLKSDMLLKMGAMVFGSITLATTIIIGTVAFLVGS